MAKNKTSDEEYFQIDAGWKMPKLDLSADDKKTKKQKAKDNKDLRKAFKGRG